MELLSPEFWAALLSIILIDLVLAGDNAIVIGLAARNVPQKDQKKVIIWGTVGAILIRVVMTLLVVQLLNIPGLRLAGGLALVWIAYKLIVDEKSHEINAGNQMWAAIRTIIIADAMMGLDNVLAVAGAAHGDFLLVIIGLAVSVPIMVWGSTLILKLTERFPIVITIGAAVLAWTAAKMIVQEPLIDELFASNWIKYGFEVLVIIAVIGIGTQMKKRKARLREAAQAQV
ncbi:MAG: TerC family protein [Paenibacillus macerans]|uniref:Integral membrane, YjbE family protein n=1 Tax=Paenibacillus macerans TaxID=44252 RepID=A0A091A028_PAEMA|nr:TerC family protein [Paenibacillus macerans]KFN09671.1 integral membrane, YjbE family protein [Paenibacillus macerans]MCY7560375.1 TerC family protein [Paenibacillus macerans]MDU7477807.1 TerC family protein [Paenibacillus macerans]MEC0137114.1 TerC family protein [Paenibacillus macerans]MEC0154741.1 TerC family protein [Paenibacillus macerans]